MQFQGHLISKINPKNQVCSFVQILPSSGNSAHFGFKHPQLILHILWYENKLTILSNGQTNLVLTYTQAQLLSSKRRGEILFTWLKSKWGNLLI